MKRPLRNNSHLPHKLCVICGKPFAWRKKWEKNWETVLYCSDQCRKQKKKSKRPNNGNGSDSIDD
ncbi:MAG: DUF2256 domain-containing protein [Fimbriimonadaceae bacterium]|jgi:hypothetical protein|nr:DUF2256 domain-containing protein [Fimbriimonadaceae bacterium]